MYARLLALLILAGLHESQAAVNRRRWAAKTPEQRKAEMAKVTEAKVRTSRERRITELIETAPPFTAEQRARLTALLDANASQDRRRV